MNTLFNDIKIYFNKVKLPYTYKIEKDYHVNKEYKVLVFYMMKIFMI